MELFWAQAAFGRELYARGEQPAPATAPTPTPQHQWGQLLGGTGLSPSSPSHSWPRLGCGPEGGLDRGVEGDALAEV